MLPLRIFAKLHPNYFQARKFSASVTRKSEHAIYAIASGVSQKCGLAVVRVSGKSSLNILAKLTNKCEETYEPRKMYVRNIWHPVTKEKIDKSLVVWFKEPNSYTGENVCEFHIHGGPAVISGLFNAFSAFENLKHAEPGEFSRRAFVNGRMDLVEIEGLVDLINAETEMQRKQALSQMEGSLSKLYNQWRQQIIKCLANVEAFIDFYEEENLEENILHIADEEVKKLIASLESHLNDERRGERLRNGVRVSIIGQTNAGKSSLLNSICKRPASIVSHIPGTTRDVIESALNIAGYPVLLSDTAGLRETEDVVEIEGVKRAIQKIESADILILVIDLKQHYDKIIATGLEEFIKNHIDSQLNLKTSSQNIIKEKQLVISFNKKDTLNAEQINNLDADINKLSSKIFINKISCKNEGMDDEINELIIQLKSIITNLCSNALSEMPSLTQQRHRDNLTKCLTCLKNYLDKTNESSGESLYGGDYALFAEELRWACKWIGNITGHICTEQILDVIFRDFCIGK